MEKNPYSALTLTPWSDTDHSILDNATTMGRCLQRTKNDLIEKALEYKKEFNSCYPNESRIFYLIPEGSEQEAFEKHQLRLAEFAALFLPWISSIKTVDLPSELQGGVVIAKDKNFSVFTKDKYLLAIDLSGRRKYLVFVKKPSDFHFSQKKFYLAEKV